MKRNNKKYERFLINSEAVRSAHIPISHAHIQYGRLLTYYWYISKTSHIPEFPINRKREIINMSCLTSIKDGHSQMTVQR